MPVEASIARDELAARIVEGASSTLLSEEFEVSRATISRHVRKNGLPNPGRGDTIKNMDSVRKRVFEMQPLDAVNWLLDILEDLAPAQSGDKLAFLREKLPGFTKLQVQVVAVLSSHRRGHTFTKQNIFDSIYAHRIQDDDTPDIRVIYVAICHVRAKLKLLCPDVSIETVYGVGYKLSDDSRFPWENLNE